MDEIDAVIFDVDGVIVDVSQSYRKAILKSVEIVTGKVLGSEDIERLKAIPGFNEDWDVSYALAYGVEQPLREETRMAPEYKRLKDVYQMLYLGRELFEKCYGRAPPELPDGTETELVKRDRLLLREETMQELSRMGLKFGVVTSRPRFEALVALAPLKGYFGASAIIAKEDCDKEKPDPKPLLLAKERLGCASPIYVGDNISDALAAKAAAFPCVCIVPDGRRLGDFQLTDVNRLPSFLMEKGFVSANGRL